MPDIPKTFCSTCRRDCTAFVKQLWAACGSRVCTLDHSLCLSCWKKHIIRSQMGMCLMGCAHLVTRTFLAACPIARVLHSVAIYGQLFYCFVTKACARRPGAAASAAPCLQGRQASSPMRLSSQAFKRMHFLSQLRMSLVCELICIATQAAHGVLDCQSQVYLRFACVTLLVLRDCCARVSPHDCLTCVCSCDCSYACVAS